MRLIARTKENCFDIIRLMIYESEEGVFLFGFSTMIDSNSKWDSYFDSTRLAMESAMVDYNIGFNDWIQISDPDIDCQHDWIGKIQTIVENNQRLFFNKEYKLFIKPEEQDNNLRGMTMNERLFHSGLLSEYLESESVDHEKTKKIIKYLTIEEQNK
jgi:hypothetical protein